MPFLHGPYDMQRQQPDTKRYKTHHLAHGTITAIKANPFMKCDILSAVTFHIH
jgi:hypothetical protein